MTTKLEQHKKMLAKLMDTKRDMRFTPDEKISCWDSDCDGEVKYLPKPIPAVEIEEYGYGIPPTKTHLLIYAKCDKCGKEWKVENEFDKWRRSRTFDLVGAITERKEIVQMKLEELEKAKEAVTEARLNVRLAIKEKQIWVHIPLR